MHLKKKIPNIKCYRNIEIYGLRFFFFFALTVLKNDIIQLIYNPFLISFLPVVVFSLKNHPHHQFGKSHGPNYTFQGKAESRSSTVFRAQLKQTSPVVQTPRWHFELLPELHCFILAICDCGRGARQKIIPVSAQGNTNYNQFLE